MNVDEKTRKLIALGASVAANCQPCVERHKRDAEQLGIPQEHILTALQVGRNVREGAASRMDDYIGGAGSDTPPMPLSKKCCC